LQLGDQAHSISAVLGLARNLYIVLIVDQPSQSFTNKGVIVSENEAQLGLCGPMRMTRDGKDA
jgi:hypothetical protein